MNNQEELLSLIQGAAAEYSCDFDDRDFATTVEISCHDGWAKAEINEPIPASDLRISLEHLHEILERLVADGSIEPVTMNVDQIIALVKSEI